MLPVSTRIEIPRKWLISSSSAVNLSSPICLPWCQMGCTVGSGNSHLLISPLTCSLLASGSWRHAAKCCIWPFSTIAWEICPCLPNDARVSSAAALSPNTRAASRLRPMVAAVSSRFFCAYCLSVKIEAVLSSSQTSVMEITTLITLMRRSARLKVGRGVCEKSLFMWFLRASIRTSGLTRTPLCVRTSRLTEKRTRSSLMIRQNALPIEQSVFCSAMSNSGLGP